MLVISGWGYTYLKTDQDRLWFDEGMKNGWRLRPPAAPFWRCWGIRHLRWIVQSYRVMEWDRRFIALGIRPPGYEAWACYAILRGWL